MNFMKRNVEQEVTDQLAYRRKMLQDWRGERLTGHQINLASIDLNLLVALEALLEYRNVTHAGQHIGRSQPAMSRALGRLRGLFNDDLLVRSSTGLIPTPQGEHLAQRLPSALRTIREMVTSRSVISKESGRGATLAIPDHQALAVLPRLLPWLRERAPHLDTLACLPFDRAVRGLEQGDIDLAVGHIDVQLPGYFRRSLYTDRFACLLRHDHPALAQEWTIDNFATLRHAAISTDSPDHFGPIYDHLPNLRADRSPILFSGVLTAAVVASATDLVLLVPRRVATQVSAMLPLRVVDPPLEPAPYKVMLIWHERCHHDPQHKWLRKEVAAALETGAD
ncbi:LysR substrate-binding domain-containing protein [Rhizobium lentis]|nr:LysR substrate-binding domain-containing protein [Rhizobium lentis]